MNDREQQPAQTAQLTDEQREAIEFAAVNLERSWTAIDRARATHLRAVLSAFPESDTTDYEALEREHLGDPDGRTGIYATKSAVVLDDERAAFEAWGNETFNYGFHPETWDAGTELPVAREACYQHEGTQMAWEGWQSRAASPQPVAQTERALTDEVISIAAKYIQTGYLHDFTAEIRTLTAAQSASGGSDV